MFEKSLKGKAVGKYMLKTYNFYIVHQNTFHNVNATVIMCKFESYLFMFIYKT